MIAHLVSPRYVDRPLPFLAPSSPAKILVSTRWNRVASALTSLICDSNQDLIECALSFVMVGKRIKISQHLQTSTLKEVCRSVKFELAYLTGKCDSSALPPRHAPGQDSLLRFVNTTTITIPINNPMFVQRRILVGSLCEEEFM